MSSLWTTLRNNLRQYMILLALLAIIIAFQIMTNGTLLKPMNVSNLIFQNAYVVILAVGMLMCILTGGNIDLSVVRWWPSWRLCRNVHHRLGLELAPLYPALLVDWYRHRSLAGVLDRLCAHPRLHRHPLGNVSVSRSNPDRVGRTHPGAVSRRFPGLFHRLYPQLLWTRPVWAEKRRLAAHRSCLGHRLLRGPDQGLVLAQKKPMRWRTLGCSCSSWPSSPPQ